MMLVMNHSFLHLSPCMEYLFRRMCMLLGTCSWMNRRVDIVFSRMARKKKVVREEPFFMARCGTLVGSCKEVKTANVLNRVVPMQYIFC